MSVRPRIAMLLALLLGGWLMFDGVRALTVGDYLTPRSGDFAGQLGPWSHVVAAVGLEPRSTLMKSVHVGLGVSWLIAAIGTVTQQTWGRRAILWCSMASLWYVPIGTLIGLVQLMLQIFKQNPRLRPPASA